MTIDEFLIKYQSIVHEFQYADKFLVKDHHNFCPISAVLDSLTKEEDKNTIELSEFMQNGQKLGLSNKDIKVIVYSFDNETNSKHFSEEIRNKLLSYFQNKLGE